MDDINSKIIISHIRQMNETMPLGYLKRNHLQYSYVSYISMATTLFLADNYNGSGLFISRARKSLNEVGIENFDADFVRHTTFFLDLLAKDLIDKNLVTDDYVKKQLTDKNAA